MLRYMDYTIKEWQKFAKLFRERGDHRSAWECECKAEQALHAEEDAKRDAKFAADIKRIMGA